MPAIACPNCKRQFKVRIPVHNCMRVQRHDRDNQKRQMKLWLLTTARYDGRYRVLGPYGDESSRVRAAKRLWQEGAVVRLTSADKPDVAAFTRKEMGL